MMTIMWNAEEMCNVIFLHNTNGFNIADHVTGVKITVKDRAKIPEYQTLDSGFFLFRPQINHHYTHISNHPNT